MRRIKTCKKYIIRNLIQTRYYIPISNINHICNKTPAKYKHPFSLFLPFHF